MSNCRVDKIPDIKLVKNVDGLLKENQVLKKIIQLLKLEVKKLDARVKELE